MTLIWIQIIKVMFHKISWMNKKWKVVRDKFLLAMKNNFITIRLWVIIILASITKWMIKITSTCQHSTQVVKCLSRVNMMKMNIMQTQLVTKTVHTFIICQWSQNLRSTITKTNKIFQKELMKILKRLMPFQTNKTLIINSIWMLIKLHKINHNAILMV